MLLFLLSARGDWRRAPGVTRGPLWWLWFRLTRRRQCSDEFLYRTWLSNGRREVRYGTGVVVETGERPPLVIGDE